VRLSKSVVNLGEGAVEVQEELRHDLEESDCKYLVGVDCSSSTEGEGADW